MDKIYVGGIIKKRILLLIFAVVVALTVSGTGYYQFFYKKNHQQLSEADKVNETVNQKVLLPAPSESQILSDFKDKKNAEDEIAKQLLYVNFDKSKADKKYIQDKGQAGDSHALTYIAKNYSKLSSETKALYSKYTNTLVPKLEITEAVKVDENGNILASENFKVASNNSKFSFIPEARAEDSGGAIQDEWRSLTNVILNDDCAIFYTTKNIYPNNDALETDATQAFNEAREIANSCTASAKKYEGWGWKTPKVKIYDDSLSNTTGATTLAQLKKYLEVDSTKNRIPVFIYNTNKDASLGLTYFNGREYFKKFNETPGLSMPLERAIVLLANQIKKNVPPDLTLTYEMKYVMSHENSHFISSYSYGYDADGFPYSMYGEHSCETFTEWSSTTSLPSFDKMTYYNYRAIYDNKNELNKNLRTWLEENSYNSYPLFRFYQHYADYFKSLPLEKSTAYTEDPLAMVGKKLQDKYGATRDTQKMIGGFWRDFWVKNLTHGYTNQVFNEPKNYNFWNYPSSADQTVYITPNGSKLVQDGRLVDSTKSGSYDLIRIEKNKLSGPKILKFESSPTFLFSNVTVLDEPTKNANAKLLETRVVDGNRDVATLYPDTQGSYLVLITNGDYGVSSVNLTLKLESPRLVVNPFKDANGNGKLDVGYDYTLKKIAPTTSAISYNVKGPSYPSGANFNTGDRGYLLFGTLTAGDYFITENKPPSGWTLRTARTVKVSVPASGGRQLNFSHTPAKRIYIHSYKDTPAYNGSRQSTEPYITGFTYKVVGPNGYTATSTTYGSGYTFFQVPYLGSYTVSQTKVASGFAFTGNSTSNALSRTFTYFSTTQDTHLYYGYRENPTLYVHTINDKNANGRYDQGEGAIAGVGFKIEQSGCASSSQYKAIGSKAVGSNGLMSLKLPMGRYRVTETVPNGYLDTSPRSVVFADFCNWKTAPIRKDLYYASWKKPTITATFTQINPSGSKTLLTSSQCWIEVWTWGAKIDTIYPNTSGRGSYTLKGNTSLDLKPNCNPTSHLFAVGGDRRYDYTAGNQVLYFDFKYMPNLINMGDSSIADSGNRSVLGATKASGILDEITAYLRQLIAKSEQVFSKVNK